MCPYPSLSPAEGCRIQNRHRTIFRHSLLGANLDQMHRPDNCGKMLSLISQEMRDGSTKVNCVHCLSGRRTIAAGAEGWDDN